MENKKKATLILNSSELKQHLYAILLKLNIEIDEALNAIDGIEKIKKNTNDLLIIEEDMPFLSGIDVISIIRNELKIETHHLPIILLHNAFENKTQSVNIDNVDDYFILKIPFQFEDVSNIILNLPLSNVENFNEVKLLSSFENQFHILIVEDNIVNFKLTETYIKQILPDARISYTSNGQLAVNFFQNNKPNLVIMDIQMPVMNGYEATIEIRKLPNGANVPIIALTAGIGVGEKERCFECGMNDFMNKPILLQTFHFYFNKWLPMNNIQSKHKSSTNLVNSFVENESHFNKNEFLESIGNDEELYKEIVESLDFVDMLTKLNKSMLEENKKDVFAAAHLIKGVAKNMMMPTLATLANDLEIETKKDNAEFEKLFLQIQAEIDFLKENYFNA